jgi:hypothetical protein
VNDPGLCQRAGRPRANCYNIVVNANELPQAVARLLWDVDVRQIDLERDRSLILERVMTRGTWEAMKWLRHRYPDELIADFIRTSGRRLLAPRDLAYWSLVCNVDDVARDDDIGGGRPRWAGA